RRQGMSKCGNLTSWTTQPMICHRSGERKSILHHVEAIHCLFRLANATARRKCSRSGQVAFAAIQEIGVQREHDVSPIKSWNESRILAETHLRCKTLRFAEHRFVNAPAHLREFLLQLVAQSIARGRMRFLDQECQP